MLPRRRKLSSRRGLIVLGVVLGTAISGTAALSGFSLKSNSLLDNSNSNGVSFSSKAGNKLAGSYFEAGLVQGQSLNDVGPRQVQLKAANQKVFAKKANSFSVDGVGRVLSVPAGTYDVYVRYQGDDGKELLLRNCQRDTEYVAYCPTGTFIRVNNQNTMSDVSPALLKTQTAPIGLANRQVIDLFDPANEGNLWLESDGFNFATIRLYPRNQ
ncbi:MAG: hypothetical protein WD877_01275 [Candidatus Saccharimonadales bacterium]